MTGKSIEIEAEKTTSQTSNLSEANLSYTDEIEVEYLLANINDSFKHKHLQ